MSYRPDPTSSRLRPMPSGARPTSAASAIAGCAVALGLVFGLNWVQDRNDGSVRVVGTSPSPVSSAPVASGAPASTIAAPATTLVAATTLPATTQPAPLAPPTAENKAFVLVVGDSDALNLGPPLQRSLEKTGVVESELKYKAATGLARPDKYDWLAALVADMERWDPDIVVATLGGNDAQPINGFAVGSPEWMAEYSARVGTALDTLAAGGRTVFWVGIPSAEGDEFRARQIAVRDAQAAEVAKRPGIVYIDAWNRFTGIDKDYADYIADPRDGEFKLVRQDDGFHLNSVGAEILALDVEVAVRAELQRRGAQI